MSLSAQLARTPLADWHQANGGRLVDFAGWAMPVQYGSIVEEHNATRGAVGLFDVSHMGRLTVTGAGAAEWLDGLLTRRVADMALGRVRYSLVCKPDGGVLDDVLVTRAGEERFDLVVNASNRAKILDWFADHPPEGAVGLDDRTEATAMIAVQGPNAVARFAALASSDVGKLGYYRSATDPVRVAGVSCAVSRTGYTGEDGFELICPAGEAVGLWDALVDAGGTPCGLASRDTLRLEAGMPLYGHELNERIDPIEAGLAFAVNLTTKDGSPRTFVGSDALPETPARRRVGLAVEGKRPPREEYAVLAEGAPCGVVTSGTFSPTLGRPIAMAYVAPDYCAEGTPLAVDIRGTETSATVVPLPFYKRS